MTVVTTRSGYSIARRYSGSLPSQLLSFSPVIHEWDGISPTDVFAEFDLSNGQITSHKFYRFIDSAFDIYASDDKLIIAPKIGNYPSLFRRGLTIVPPLYQALSTPGLTAASALLGRSSGVNFYADTSIEVFDTELPYEEVIFEGSRCVAVKGFDALRTSFIAPTTFKGLLMCLRAANASTEPDDKYLPINNKTLSQLKSIVSSLSAGMVPANDLECISNLDFQNPDAQAIIFREISNDRSWLTGNHVDSSLVLFGLTANPYFQLGRYMTFGDISEADAYMTTEDDISGLVSRFYSVYNGLVDEAEHLFDETASAAFGRIMLIIAGFTSKMYLDMKQSTVQLVDNGRYVQDSPINEISSLVESTLGTMEQAAPWDYPLRWKSPGDIATTPFEQGDIGFCDALAAYFTTKFNPDGYTKSSSSLIDSIKAYPRTFNKDLDGETYSYSYPVPIYVKLQQNGSFSREKLNQIGKLLNVQDGAFRDESGAIAVSLRPDYIAVLSDKLKDMVNKAYQSTLIGIIVSMLKVQHSELSIGNRMVHYSSYLYYLLGQVILYGSLPIVGSTDHSLDGHVTHLLPCKCVYPDDPAKKEYQAWAYSRLFLLIDFIHINSITVRLGDSVNIDVDYSIKFSHTGHNFILGGYSQSESLPFTEHLAKTLVHELGNEFGINSTAYYTRASSNQNNSEIVTMCCGENVPESTLFMNCQPLERSDSFSSYGIAQARWYSYHHESNSYLVTGSATFVNNKESGLYEDMTPVVQQTQSDMRDSAAQVATDWLVNSLLQLFNTDKLSSINIATFRMLMYRLGGVISPSVYGNDHKNLIQVLTKVRDELSDIPDSYVDFKRLSPDDRALIIQFLTFMIKSYPESSVDYISVPESIPEASTPATDNVYDGGIGI